MAAAFPILQAELFFWTGSVVSGADTDVNDDDGHHQGVRQRLQRDHRTRPGARRSIHPTSGLLPRKLSLVAQFVLHFDHLTRKLAGDLLSAYQSSAFLVKLNVSSFFQSVFFLGGGEFNLLHESVT